MAIKVKCSGCSKVYQVKDEAAGKKIRCKECDKLIPVPKPKAPKVEEEDDWLDAIEEDESEDELPRRVVRPKSKASTSTKKKVKRARPSMPGSAVGVVALCVIGMAYWTFLGFAVLGGSQMLPGPAATASKGVGSIFLIWAIVDLTTIIGLFLRVNIIRYIGLVFDGIGFICSMIAIILSIIGIAMAASNLQPGQAINWGRFIGVQVVYIFAAVIWLIDFSLLRSDSTVDYMND